MKLGGHPTYYTRRNATTLTFRTRHHHASRRFHSCTSPFVFLVGILSTQRHPAMRTRCLDPKVARDDVPWDIFALHARMTIAPETVHLFAIARKVVLFLEVDHQAPSVSCNSGFTRWPVACPLASEFGGVRCFSSSTAWSGHRRCEGFNPMQESDIGEETHKCPIQELVQLLYPVQRYYTKKHQDQDARTARAGKCFPVVHLYWKWSQD
jgi:hypothetical protein